MRSQLTRAWCNELGKTVTIDEAHQIATQHRPPLRFTFSCPDRECRSLFRPKVVGALYRQDVSVENRRARYFRVHPDTPHRPGCPEIVNAGQTSKPRVAAERADPIKATNHIDEFRPREDDGPMATSHSRPRTEHVVVDDTEAITPVRVSSGAGATIDHRMERLLAVYQRLDPDERRLTPLMFDGQALTYFNAFVSPRHLLERELNARRIVRGNARYGWDERGAWILEWYDSLARLPPCQGLSTLRLELPLSRLDRTAAGRRLMAMLTDQSSERAHYFLVAALGRIEAAREGGYEMHLASLFNLALVRQYTNRGRSENATQTATRS